MKWRFFYPLTIGISLIVVFFIGLIVGKIQTQNLRDEENNILEFLTITGEGNGSESFPLMSISGPDDLLAKGLILSDQSDCVEIDDHGNLKAVHLNNIRMMAENTAFIQSQYAAKLTDLLGENTRLEKDRQYVNFIFDSLGENVEKHTLTRLQSLECPERKVIFCVKVFGSSYWVFTVL